MSGHIEEATKLDDQMLKDKPNDVAGRMIQGRLQAIKGDFPAAVITFRGVVKDSPENPQAHSFWDRRCLRRIIRMIWRAQRLNSRKPSSVILTIRSTSRPRPRPTATDGDFATAREFANRLLKLNDKNPQTHYLLASIDLGDKQFQAALEELSIVAQAAPNDPSVHLNMAFAYGGLKKFPEAEREFQTAMKLNPQYDSAMGEYVGMLFGLNQGPKALQVASQYATANPNRVAAQFIYASALANSKKLDEAIPVYQKAIQLEPKVAVVIYAIGPRV